MRQDEKQSLRTVSRLSNRASSASPWGGPKAEPGELCEPVGRAEGRTGRVLPHLLASRLVTQIVAALISTLPAMVDQVGTSLKTA